MNNSTLIIGNASELKNDPYVSNWLLTIDARPNTERNYLQAIKGFCEFTQKTPEKLILEAELEIKSGLLPRERSIKIYLLNFKKSLQQDRKADLTVRAYLNSVKSFYNSYDVELPNLGRNKAKALEKNKNIPTKEDLQEVLKICDSLEKAVLLVGISSGLALNEIRNLKVKDFKSGYDPETGITTLKLRRQKVEFDFITFLSQEAGRAVIDYLSYRGRSTNFIDHRREEYLAKQKIYSDDDYLFCVRKVSNKFLTTKNEEFRQFKEGSLKRVFQEISEKAQKTTPKGDWNLIRSHNMRKYFYSAMLNAGADSFHVEFFMGHTLDETKSAYFRANPEKLRDLYQKYVPYLTIQKDVDISESPEYLKIKQENQILQAETARHIVERSELRELRAEVEMIKKINEDTAKFQQKVINSDDPMVLALLKKFLNECENQ